MTLDLLLGWFVIGVHFYMWYTVFLQGMRTPNAAEDCLQPENSGTAVTALTVYSNVLLVRPQSYVSPPKVSLTVTVNSWMLIG